MTTEPIATSLLLVLFGALLIVSVLFSRAVERFPVPVALVFLGIGVLAGSDGIGGIAFEDYAFAFRIGAIALVLILYDGGLNTPVAAVRDAAKPAASLATVGVVGSAGIVAVAAHMLGMPWPPALLLGAIVSSTDAAAVFSVLRGSGIHLKRRVGTTLEVESGINDPMAVILTIAMTERLLATESQPVLGIVVAVVQEFIIGGTLGFAIGWVGRWLLTNGRLPFGGLYPVLSLGLACIAFAVPTLLHGSGFLAVYVAGVVIGDGRLPFRAGLLRVHDSLAWLAQITMFLMLGLLVFPSRLGPSLGIGLVLSLVLTFVARPIVTAVCLAPFRAFQAREVAYIGWVGLRGAVPIILAIFPVLAGAPGAGDVFNIVFIMVVMNAILPGATVPWVTRRLRMSSPEPPAPAAVLAIESSLPLKGQLLSFYIDEALAVAGVPLSELPFPDGASAVLVVRGGELLAPNGRMALLPGDHAYVFTKPEGLAMLQLMFGRPEDD